MDISIGNWIYIPFLVTFLQGMLVAIALFRNGQNPYLTFLILLLSLGALLDTGIFRDDNLWINAIWSGNEFLFGPLLFLGISRQTRVTITNKPAHFLVFVAMKVMVVILLVMPSIESSAARWFSVLLSISIALHGLAYTAYSLSSLYMPNQGVHFSETKWLRLLVWIFLIAWVLALTSKVIRPFSILWARNLFYVTYCLVLVSIYYVSFIVTDRIFPHLAISREPSGAGKGGATQEPAERLSRGTDADGQANKYYKSSLTPAQIDAHKKSVLSYLEREKPYLEVDFSLTQLSADLKISHHHLSQTFSSGFGKTFPQFIRELRVAEVVKRLGDAKYAHLSIYGIALECGFNSKSTFNQVFKEQTGLTPSGYKKANNIF